MFHYLLMFMFPFYIVPMQPKVQLQPGRVAQREGLLLIFDTACNTYSLTCCHKPGNHTPRENRIKQNRSTVYYSGVRQCFAWCDVCITINKLDNLKVSDNSSTPTSYSQIFPYQLEQVVMNTLIVFLIVGRSLQKERKQK